MKKNSFVVKNGKELRTGYTTGSCAAAAAAAAVRMLLSGQRISEAGIVLANGQAAVFEIIDIYMDSEKVRCSVIKDAGDDPDATDGIRISAVVSRSDGTELLIDGGEGVGRVTGKGLQCAVGEAAINPVPRRMIGENVRRVADELSYEGGLQIIIEAENGEQIAQKTFNPRLGIVGGISILGTTGMVEPMSEKALVDTIKVLIDRHKADDPHTVLITPGNYGREYCRKNLGFDLDKGVKFSNYIGETLDYLVYSGFERVLLVGHMGKLVKIAGGVMNTHSSYADCRMEILAAHSALLGADAVTVRRIMGCPTTDAAIEVLDQAELSEKVFASVLAKIVYHINYRIKGKMQVEVLMFSSGDRVIAMTEHAAEFAALIKTEEEKQLVN